MADIPTAVLQRQRRTARSRCGYCRTSALVIGQPLTVEHIQPASLGGTSDEDNLWLSCRRSNEFKGAQINAVAPETGLVVLLFNPRHQVWREHFSWSNSGTHIVGITPAGRATVDGLRLNNPEIVAARLLWVGAGWHPPAA